MGASCFWLVGSVEFDALGECAPVLEVGMIFLLLVRCASSATISETRGRSSALVTEAGAGVGVDVGMELEEELVLKMLSVPDRRCATRCSTGDVAASESIAALWPLDACEAWKLGFPELKGRTFGASEEDLLRPSRLADNSPSTIDPSVSDES